MDGCDDISVHQLSTVASRSSTQVPWFLRLRPPPFSACFGYIKPTSSLLAAFHADSHAMVVIKDDGLLLPDSERSIGG